MSFFVVYWSRDNAVRQPDKTHHEVSIYSRVCPCHFFYNTPTTLVFAVMANFNQPECWPMPNVMVALPNIGGALCSMPQTLADAHY